MRLTDRTIDLARLTIEHDDGETNTLTAREGALLAYLAERPEQDVSRDELLEKVWEYRANYATRAVDVAMRRLRSKIEPDPSSPVHLISVHGVGYRFVPATPAATTPVDPGATDRHTNLPADQTTFVGRADDLAAVARQFRSGARLVTVLGPGGIGKTRLAQRFGRTVLESAAPPGGVWFCDLSETVALPGLLAAVASALGVPIAGGASGEQLADQLGHALAERGPILVLLDNFEQVVRLAGQTVQRWMRRAPQARFLVASRERLRIAGEAIYELGPLREEDALSLFVERARAAGADVDDQDASVRAIIQRLDGLPLAIELAAPRARVLAPPQLLDRLSARFRLLRSGANGASVRQATLRGAIDWSWELLTRWEREALAQCAVFSGGFTLEAVEAVVRIEEDDAPWALDIVEALRDKSLLRVYEPPNLPGELRFGMYESIRAYAIEHLDPAAAAAAHARHAAWYLAEGERLSAALDGHGGVEAAQRLVLELDNLLAVWRRQSATDPATAVRAALVLEAAFQAQGPFDAWIDLVDDVVAVAEDLEPELLARALTARANAAGLRGQLDRARQDLAVALSLVADRADEEELRVLHGLAVVDAEQSRIGDAMHGLERALGIARTLRLRRWEGVLLGLIGAVQLMQGDVPGAEDGLRRALVIHQEVGNERHQALTWANLGMIQLDLARLEEAERHLQQALAIDRRLANPRRVATSLLTLGAVRCAEWRLEEAEALIRDALRVYRSVGYRRFGGVATSTLGAIFLAQGRTDAALEQLRGALDVLEDVGDRHSTCLTVALLAGVHAEREELDAAGRMLQQATALAEELAYGQGFAYARAARGYVVLGKVRDAHRRGASAEAERLLEEARRLQLGEPGDERYHARRFFAAILERAIARSNRAVPRGPW